LESKKIVKKDINFEERNELLSYFNKKNEAFLYLLIFKEI